MAKQIDEGSWFPFYAGQYLQDEKVQALSWKTRAVWHECLPRLWVAPACKMKINLKRLANLIRIPLEVLKEAWPDLTEDEDPMFESDEKFFWSKRLCNQRAIMEQAYLAKKEGGRKGAAKRWENRSPNRSPNGSPNGSPNRLPKSNPMQEKEKEYNNTSSYSFSSNGSPISHPMGHPSQSPAALIKELHAEANQQADNLINQSGSIGMYGTPEGRNEITLQVMKKSYFSWSTICNLQQGTTPKWKAAFIDEYKRQSQKKGKTP